MTIATTSVASPGYVRYVIALLAAVMLLNQLDRVVLSILVEPIRLDLGLTDTQLGLLQGLAFAIFYTVCGIPLARLADTWRRPPLLGACIAVWSVMTALCGLAGSFSQLLLMRIGVAVGEAGSQPASHTLIADYVAPERRVSAFALVSAGGSLGIMLSLVVGGSLADLVGWRWTMAAVGAAGLPIALLTWLTLAEPRRAAAAKLREDQVGIVETLRHLAGSKIYILLVLSGVLCVTPTAAVTAWAPAYFMRVHGLSSTEVGLWIGVASGAGNLIGSIGSGFLADRVGRANPARGLLVPVVTMGACAPLFVFAFLAQDARLAAILYVMPICLYTTWYAPVFAAIQTISPVRMRAQAAAVGIFMTSLIGIGVGPTLAGVVSDLLAPTFGVRSLGAALALIGSGTLIGAVFLWFTSRSMRGLRAGPPTRAIGPKAR